MQFADINTKMTTPAEILEDRKARRQAGVLAHSSNVSGEFYAREGCTCYNCRDVLDPTGELDAKIQNDAMPATSPTLERQYAMCSDCSEQHSCETKCRPRTLSLNLPPPSPATRTVAVPSGLISPVTGFMTPRSISDTPVSLEEQVKLCEAMEYKVIRYLKRLLKQYNRLEELITADTSHSSHDEMAAYDAWWSEIDDKIGSTEDLLNVLKKD